MTLDPFPFLNTFCHSCGGNCVELAWLVLSLMAVINGSGVGFIELTSCPSDCWLLLLLLSLLRLAWLGSDLGLLILTGPHYADKRRKQPFDLPPLDWLESCQFLTGKVTRCPSRGVKLLPLRVISRSISPS